MGSLGPLQVSMRLLVASLALTFLAGQRQTPAIDADAVGLLQLGIRQYEEGDFHSALFALDAAISKFTGRGQPAVDPLARAHLYMGATLVSLKNEAAARGRFRKALALSPQITLDETRFPERVVRLFREEALGKTASIKKRRAVLFLIAGSVGAGASLGIGSAMRPEVPNVAPIAALRASPPGRGIAAATTFTFVAVARDANNDPLTYAWDFGDGLTASATAASSQHTFQREGSFNVTATVTDPAGGTASATTNVTVGSLSGQWYEGDDRVYVLTQNGPNLSGRRLCPSIPRQCSAVITGRVAHPRRVTLTYIEEVSGVGGNRTDTVDADEGLAIMSGGYTIRYDFGTFGGSVALSRQ